MIDLHSHIIPGIDDGSPDMETSVRMLQIAADSGTRIIAATPHCNAGEFALNYFDENLKRRYLTLRKTVQDKKIPIQVVLGSEVFSTPNMPDLYRKGMLRTLNGSRYLLIEFDFGEDDPGYFEYIILELLAQGCVPVIAHPERYRLVQDQPGIIYYWINLGALTQVNRGSFQGRFGRGAERAAYALLQHHLVTAVGSDAHRDDIRTPDMRGIAELLSRESSFYESNMICEANPVRILKNLDVSMPAAEDIVAL